MSLIICLETSEDISPYATFQLSEASTLAQPHHTGPTNTLLHSFMYHERALQEGCASPAPPAVLRKPHKSSSPYYNVVRLFFNWNIFIFSFVVTPFAELLTVRYLT